MVAKPSDDKERERRNPGAGAAHRNNAQGPDSAALPGGSDEDINKKRRRGTAWPDRGAKLAAGDRKPGGRTR